VGIEKQGKRPPGRATTEVVAPRRFPHTLTPELATLVGEAPTGDGWLHETKFDGFRILCRLVHGRATLFTRTGQDWTKRFDAVVAAAEALPVERAWLDGEVTVLLADGRTSFGALQNQADGERAGQALVYFVFDLLHQDGRDLRRLPLETRKRALAALLGKRGGPLRYTAHVEGDGPACFAKACRAGWEGIVSKRRDRPHVPGRTFDWLKTKCVKQQEFVIGGFTGPKSGRRSLGALLVGVYEGEQLRYAGKVGTGFGHAAGAELRRRLEALERGSSPFSPAVNPLPRDVHWTAPKLLAEVAFTEMTTDGKLRHPSFKGLRDDKPATEVVREVPAAVDVTASPPRPPRAGPAAPAPPPPSSVALTHPGRVLYPDVGITKQELAAYYDAIGAQLLPHLKGRPLTLVRCPGGTAKACFFMKHAPEGRLPALRRIHLREKKASGAYLLVDTQAGLGALAQMSVLEFHTWSSTEADIDAPDRLVFDLDPGPAVAWRDVVRAARTVHDRLRHLKLPAFLKTTGGRGLHVVVPLRPEVAWGPTLAFARSVAEAIAAEEPALYTTALPKAGREAKIFVDYLRNQRGATAVAAFSTRARPGAPVSVPLDWDELDDVSPARPLTVRSLPGRLAALKRDPWHAYEGGRRSLKDLVS